MWHKFSFLKPLYGKMERRPYGILFGVLTIIGFLYTLGFSLAHLTEAPKPEAVILFALVVNAYFVIMSILNIKRIHDISDNLVLALSATAALFAALCFGDYTFGRLAVNVAFVVVCLFLVFIPGKAERELLVVCKN